MARAVGRLKAAGFAQISDDAHGRRYRAPDGRELSYRAAFKEARGETLEEAVHDTQRTPSGRAIGRNGKFSDELRIAERVRFLAREGLLSDAQIVSKKDERAMASRTLRQLTKGHYQSEGTKAGIRGKLKSTDIYERAILAKLHAQPRLLKAKPNETASSIEKRQRAERLRVNGPTSTKANLLVALGFREPSADYNVGDTP